MRHSLLLVASLLLAACERPAATPTPAALTAADKAAINAAIDSALKIANTAPFNAAAYVKAYYTEDAVLMPPNDTARTGRANIEPWFAALPGVNSVAFKLEAVDGMDGVAWLRGRYTFTVVPPGSTAVVDSGKYLEIWKRQADGSWRSAIDAFNSDLPVAGPPAAK